LRPPQREAAPGTPACDPPPEGGVRSAIGPERAGDESDRRAVERRPVVVAEHEHQPCHRRPIDSRGAREPSGELQSGEVLQPVQLERRDGGHHARTGAEAGALEPADRHPGEPPRPREGTQLGCRWTPAAERRDTGGCRDAAAGDDRADDVLEERGPSQETACPERGDPPQERIATAEAVKGGEIQVEVERASDPCGERRQDLDLARVLAACPQDDAIGMRSDREQQDGTSR
jgi:hypothetical protein